MQRLLPYMSEGTEDGSLALREQVLTADADLSAEPLSCVVLVVCVVGERVFCC